MEEAFIQAAAHVYATVYVNNINNTNNELTAQIEASHAMKDYLIEIRRLMDVKVTSNEA